MAGLSWILSTAVICILLVGGQAIKCWDCTGVSCIDDFNESVDGISETGDDCDYCVKTKIYYASGVSTVDRSCYQLTGNEGESDDATDDVCSRCKFRTSCGADKESCFCKSDLCNTSSRNLPMLTGILSLALLLAKFF